MHPSPPLQSWRLKRACAYVEAHLSEPLPLAELSRAAGFTAMHFARLFRASTGLSPHNYVLRRRIEVAQAALLHTDHGMLDVALMVGFRTQAHFSAVFKKLTGMPPRRWRQARLAGWRGRPDVRVSAPKAPASAPGSPPTRTPAARSS